MNSPIKAGGFVAATPVHTKDGLVPIEHVTVGTSLLSGPSDTAALSLSRVAKAYAIADSEVYSLSYFPRDAFETAKRTGKLMSHGHNAEVISNAHAYFWASGYSAKSPSPVQWTKADEFLSDKFRQLHLINGGFSLAFEWSVLHQTATDDVGWVQGGFDSESGRLVDFRNGAIRTDFDHTKEVLNEGIDWVDGEAHLRRTVYCLEMEDGRGFYVGQAGVLAACAAPK